MHYVQGIYVKIMKKNENLNFFWDLVGFELGLADLKQILLSDYLQSMYTGQFHSK